jgi:hypothetical protein
MNRPLKAKLLLDLIELQQHLVGYQLYTVDEQYYINCLKHIIKYLEEPYNSSLD